MTSFCPGSGCGLASVVDCLLGFIPVVQVPQPFVVAACLLLPLGKPRVGVWSCELSISLDAQPGETLMFCASTCVASSVLT